jgi:hypothetical protein
MFVDAFVANLSDLIDKDHDVGLENLSGVSEISDIAKSINGHNLLTGYHHIDYPRIFNNSANNLSSGLSESDCQ